MVGMVEVGKGTWTWCSHYYCRDKIWSPSPDFMESWSKEPNTMNFVEYGLKT